MFTKNVVIECDVHYIEQLVEKHYPQFGMYEMYAYEEHDNSVMVKYVSASDISEHDQTRFDAGEAMYMAGVILNKLCFDGLIEPGKYMIDGTW